MVTSFSIVPLRLVTLLGLSMAILSLFVVVCVVVYRIMHPEMTAGWASIIAVILFIGGVQTFCIGMLGEYVGRTYLRINRKPQFVVRTTTWTSENAT
jgi:polyisoprenyl-phosphate glycosyltransferase